MEIFLVNKANAHLYEAELDAFFAARYHIYVEEKGWMPENPEHREKDQFDTDHAHYMIGIDTGRVIAGSRFVATIHPHLLSEVFPYTCTERPLVGASVAEWTRGFILPEFRGSSVMSEFCSAVMEWCLDEGVTHVGGIQEIYWLPLWRRFGWVFVPIGEPIEIDGDTCVPGYCEVSEAALEKVRRRAGLRCSNLIRRGPQLSFVEQGVSA